jgi:hypothetical protein
MMAIGMIQIVNSRASNIKNIEWKLRRTRMHEEGKEAQIAFSFYRLKASNQCHLITSPRKSY